jgi:PAS domain S-box-containing protein
MSSAQNSFTTVQTAGGEPKPSEEALRESGERLQSILRNVPGMVVQFHVRENGTVGVNYISEHPMMRTQVGAPSMDAAFARLLAAIAPEDREPFLTSIRAAAASVSTWRFEGRFLQPAAEPWHFSGVAQPRRLHGELVFDGLIQDVTGRKHAEIALRESEAAFRSLFEAGPTAVGLLVNRRFQQVNSLMCKLTGYSEAECLGQSVRIQYADDAEFDRVGRELYGRLEQKGVGMLEARHRRKNGELYDVLICARLLDRKNPAKGTVVTVLDITNLKQTEAALHASERKLAGIFQVIPEVIAVTTAGEGRILEVNDACARVFGYLREEVLGHTMQELGIWCSTADRERVANLAKAGGRANNLEVQLRKKSGETVHALLSIAPLTLEGRPCIISVITDITERKQAETALKESEEAFRSLFEAGPAVATLVVDRKFRRVNSLMGYTEAELLGQSTRIQYPDDAEFERAGRELYGGIERDGVGIVEARHRRKNGELCDVLLCARLLDPKNPAKGVVANVLDITERKRAQERLREQAALLDAATDAIYVRALDHTVTYWNDAAERLFDWPRAEALGRKITDFAEVARAAFEAAHATLLQQGSWSGELTKLNRAGKKLVLFCRWTLLRDEQGRPKAVLAINTDITERKQLEANFLRAQRMEGLGALAGGIAHDLNNILAPILVSAPVLSATLTDPESIEMLNTMAACAKRGADIIRQLLTFARGTPDEHLPLPLQHLLRDMDKIIHETFPRNISASLVAPKELWPVMGDATQIQQALMNLCINARDAMPEGGRLTLEAANLTLDEALAKTMPDAKPGPCVCLKITDTGTGIVAEHLEHIFDPFFTTKAIGKGTGLGLPTVLGIVRGHGGCLRVKTEAGRGTTFELYLPAAPQAQTADPGEPEPLPARAGGELILVVDDEASLRAAIERVLKERGYTVITAANGAEALRLFAGRQREIRAVLTDMMMPVMDGPALIRALRPQAPRLPILAMSGIGETAAFKELEALETVKLLTKPFERNVLLAELRRAVQSSQPAS